jgi:hypothetical protein
MENNSEAPVCTERERWKEVKNARKERKWKREEKRGGQCEKFVNLH